MFVYDKQYLSPSRDDQPALSQAPEPLDLRDPPATLANHTSLRAWHDLFKSRSNWAANLSEAVEPLVEIVRRNIEEAEIIQRALDLALDNLQTHVQNLGAKFEDTKIWAKEASEEHETLLRDWQGNLEVLGKVPIKHNFGFLLRNKPSPLKRKHSRSLSRDVDTLRSLIGDEEVEAAASELRVFSHDFRTQLSELEASMEDISHGTQRVHSDSQTPVGLDPEEISNLVADIATLRKKIATDYEDMLQLPDLARSIPIASRRALTHTRDLLPSLAKLAAEISSDARKAVVARNTILETSTRALRSISLIQFNLAEFQPQLSNLGLSTEGDEALDHVRCVFDMPIIYGSILVESVQRFEWAEGLGANSEQLKEDLESCAEIEQRRRKKWLKSMGGLIREAPDAIDLAIDMKIAPGKEVWPATNRHDLSDYVEHVRAAGIDDAVQHVTGMLKELDSSRLRKRITRAFKNGSVFQADLRSDRSSVLLDDDEETLRSLRSENSRLEDKLRSSDSRVRKLEDLLHRHSQMARPASTHFGVSPTPSEMDRHLQSPGANPSPRPIELMSRRSSASSRRLSSNQNPDDRAYIQKIVTLEADLRAERETVTRLQRESHADRRASTENRDRMNEAMSTKKDLLANLDAQRQEFDDERQILDDDIHKLKIKLEEMEDELDRVLGSRDHQKVTGEANIARLQAELERARSNGEMLDQQQRESQEALGSLRSRHSALSDQLRDQTRLQADYVSSLQAAHSLLSPAGSPPEELGRLARAIEILSEGAAIHARSVEESAQLALAENKSLEENLTQTKQRLEQVQQQVAGHEEQALMSKETAKQNDGIILSLRGELKEAQQETSHLRSKFAAGETGSEALKDRVNREEKRVTELTEKLAKAESHNSSFEQEISIWKEKVQSLTGEAKEWKDRLDVRGVRAKDVSQRLLAHNDRMIRMLEQMGYSVTRQSDSMVIQRASKVSASTVLPGDPSAPNAPLSGQSPTQHLSNAADLDTLYWMSDSDAVSEDTKFQQFIATVSRLDTDAASEMISKRYKDVETLARKYQKDSRAYRERAHRLQSEAHDKIAYRTFKDGDLALFLPTRNQVTRPWAAFNVGAPHYFLREQDTHKLAARDWLLARISRIEERVVDLSKSLSDNTKQPSSHRRGEPASDTTSTHSTDENPFELSDGLRWYLIDAVEEKPGSAPVLTPGLGKSTVAATNVDARGSIRLTKEGKRVRDSISGAITGGVTIASASATMASKTLSKSLDSRRSSSTSKKGHANSPSLLSNPLALASKADETAVSSRPVTPTTSAPGDSLPLGLGMTSPAPGRRESTGKDVVREDSGCVRPADGDAGKDEPAREDAALFDAVREDLLFGP